MLYWHRQPESMYNGLGTVYEIIKIKFFIIFNIFKFILM